MFLCGDVTSADRMKIICHGILPDEHSGSATHDHSDDEDCDGSKRRRSVS